tara:strand:- start:722 stop:1459 length:738 start_codon:yes stop_codon:yes gene_type:complete
MAKFPHLPLWTDAYMADTLHLTHEEHGLYLMLLMTIWRSPDCKIPNDFEWVKRRLRATDDQMENLVRNLLDEFFTTTGNHITQKRLKEEYEYVKKKSKKNSVSAKSRWQKEKVVCERNAPTPIPIPSIRDTNVSLSLKADNLFEQWYETWPRKVGKGGARKAFKTALKKTDFETLCQGRDRFIQAAIGQDKNYIPYPSTWLNQERWSDDTTAINPTPAIPIRSGNGTQSASIAAAVSGFVARRSG